MAARAATRTMASATIRSRITPTQCLSTHTIRQLPLFASPQPCIRVKGCTFKQALLPAFRCVSTQTPEQYRTLSFYKFHPIDPNSLSILRETLLKDLQSMGIVGRVYIAAEGINAQMSCPKQQLDKLSQYLQSNLKPIFGELMDLNLGTEHSRSFRALHVRIRKQLVSDGLKEGSYDLSLQPSHLHPRDWHEKLSKARASGKNPVLIDMRNHYESQIGYFEGAIKPDVETFKGSMRAMNHIVKDLPKDQEIYMYCTGKFINTRLCYLLHLYSHTV